MSGADDRYLPEPDDAGLTADDRLAIGWALGIDPDERRAAEERAATDSDFATLLALWASRLAPLSDALDAIAPSSALWERVEAAIGPLSRAPAPGAQAPAAPAAVAWWDRLAFWRGATAAFAALALGLLATRPPSPGPAPGAPLRPAEAPPRPGGAVLFSATLASERGRPLATAAIDEGGGGLVLAPVGEERLDGRVPELWLIPADGTPRSLGLIDLEQPQRVAVAPILVDLVAGGAVLAVSLEPPGGSPTGAPTGPVVATGELRPI